MKGIEIKSLTKKFKEKVAVDNITFEINNGELFGLLGVNGAGKTTTIKMLSCLTKATSGDAKVLGHSINSDTKSIKDIMNVSPQETAVAPKLSVKENLQFICEIYSINKASIQNKIKEVSEMFGLDEIMKQKAGTLSGGWQRKLSIAMALITDPKVLYLDEPTLGLDVLAKRELWDIINSLKGKVTIILTTHYMEEAEILCDRIAIMKKGKVIEIGTSKELISKAKATNFEDAFVKIVKGEN